MSLPHFIQLTDRRSKRKFAMKLTDKDQFSSLDSFVNYLQGLQHQDIVQLKEEGRIGTLGMAGLEDLRCYLFDINNDGSLGSQVEGTQIKQYGRKIKGDQPLSKFRQVITNANDSNIMVAELTLDRDEVWYDKNWEGLYTRRWNDNSKYKEFVESTLAKKNGSFRKPNSPEEQIQFLKDISSIVFAAPYELYSRFIGRKLRFKNGPDTLDAIMTGKGGNCSEKAQALCFIAQNYGIENKMVLSGHETTGPFPYDTLKRGLDEYNFNFKDDAQRYWEHYANKFVVNGKDILVDATGGPMSYIFAEGEEADAFFSLEKSSPTDFVNEKENYYYHDAPEEISKGLLFALETWENDIDIDHVLGADAEEGGEFGFLITKDLWVSPIPYQSDIEYTQYKNAWLEEAQVNPAYGTMQVYNNLDPHPQKTLLASLEEKAPQLVADMRSAQDTFLQRIRTSWRDKSWNVGYLITTLNKL